MRTESLDYGKVFRNGDLIMGVAGYLEDSQTLRYMNIPEVDTWDIDRWVTKVFMKKLDKKDILSSVLLEVEGRIYDCSGGSWTRNNAGLYLVGSGAAIARGALAAGSTTLEALQIAEQWDAGTGGPLLVQTGEEVLSEW